ncbi:hypothetical protein COCOBI_04-4730 [Coccomyxa sp. Obi]|nr:hypothetical protein COCOBI_04-4730 [Coccomyxa sp. Obi]
MSSRVRSTVKRLLLIPEAESEPDGDSSSWDAAGTVEIGREQMHGPGASPPKVHRLDLKGAGLTKHSTRPLPPHLLAGTRDMYIYEWLNDSCRDDSYSDTLATSTRFTEGPCDWASAAGSHPRTSPTSVQSYVTARHHMPPITEQDCSSWTDKELSRNMKGLLPPHWRGVPAPRLDRVDMVQLYTAPTEYYGDLEGWKDPQQFERFPLRQKRHRSEREERNDSDAEVTAVLHFLERNLRVKEHHVTSIHRVQNPRLWSNFAIRRAEMARTTSGRVKEGWRWHGRCTTRAEADFFAQYGVHSDEADMPVLLNKLLTQSSSSGDMGGIDGGYGTSERKALQEPALLLCRVVQACEHSGRQSRSGDYCYFHTGKGGLLSSRCQEQAYPEYIISTMQAFGPKC